MRRRYILAAILVFYIISLLLMEVDTIEALHLLI
jgi:hypothetical protein